MVYTKKTPWVLIMGVIMCAYAWMVQAHHLDGMIAALKTGKMVGEMAETLNADRIASIADAIDHLKTVSEFDRVIPAFGPNVDPVRLEALRKAWSAKPQIGANEIAAAKTEVQIRTRR